MIGISWGNLIRAAWELGIGIAQADPVLWPAHIIWVGLQFRRYTTNTPPHHPSSPIPTTPSLPPHKCRIEGVDHIARPPPLVVEVPGLPSASSLSNLTTPPPSALHCSPNVGSDSDLIGHRPASPTRCSRPALRFVAGYLIWRPPPPCRFTHQTSGWTRSRTDTARPPPLVVPGLPSASSLDSSDFAGRAAAAAAVVALGVVGLTFGPGRIQLFKGTGCPSHASSLHPPTSLGVGIRPRPLSFLSLVVQDN
ncbi:hypothetical protein PGT21_019159 [Puccinia graminis f. sp. tritici]|uniref:Uncharacterized protein n=1 Tax=Puccinia graminis f. sp. tritici TaxID=56615 RepID=A0A5B0Q6A0_PUCGR|nr:hypothetical protein PGT21_019159 [Puccinia graminis f. sp. tritici]